MFNVVIPKSSRRSIRNLVRNVPHIPGPIAANPRHHICRHCINLLLRHLRLVFVWLPPPTKQRVRRLFFGRASKYGISALSGLCNRGQRVFPAIFKNSRAIKGTWICGHCASSATGAQVGRFERGRRKHEKDAGHSSRVFQQGSSSVGSKCQRFDVVMERRLII